MEEMSTKKSYKLVLTRGTLPNGNGTTANQTFSLCHNGINQEKSILINVNDSYEPGRIHPRARKSFAATLTENVITQNNAIQSEAMNWQQEMDEIIKKATSDLKTTFVDSMTTFSQDLEQINDRYAKDVLELKTEYQSRLTDLKQDYERCVEAAKKKVFNN